MNVDVPQVSYFYGFETLNNMKEQIKIALWSKVKSTYPSGTSKHTNALLEEDFDSFIDDALVKNNIVVVNHTEQSFNSLKELISKIGFLYCDRTFLTKQINYW